MVNAYTLLDRRHEHWLLASMLLVLHAALDAGLDSPLSAALMTAHLGLFFLWQPIWQKDQRLQPRAVLLIAVLVAGLVITLSWWTIFVWLILLIGIMAGRSFSTRHERYVYMLSLAFLISELLIVCAAMVFFGKPLGAGIGRTFQIVLYLLPLALFAIPPITVPQRDPFPVDFFRGIAFALMTALTAVLSVLMTFRFQIDYPLALVATLIALGMLLLFLSWIATPGLGSSGLLTVWEKSVLNIGTPFEAWLSNIASLAARRSSAEDFLEAAIGELNDIPWISGAEWTTPSGSGIEGKRSSHHLTVNTESLRVTLFTERSFSSALLMHCHLLIQVLGHFYVAKQRENEEASQAHLRAIYETGARVTHDIKNLLQSLNTMANSLQGASTAEQEHRGFDLLRRRLPDVARRLQRALDKLQRPAAKPPGLVTASVWWAEFCERHADSRVTFEQQLDDAEMPLPHDCFDSVVDNLIDNAGHKVAAGEATQVRVRMSADTDRVSVEVIDDGAAIAPAVVRQLFVGPIDSNTGLGIGLYQSARQAEMVGCTLTLADNRDGHVCFMLRLDKAMPPHSRA